MYNPARVLLTGISATTKLSRPTAESRSSSIAALVACFFLSAGSELARISVRNCSSLSVICGTSCNVGTKLAKLADISFRTSVLVSMSTIEGQLYYLWQLVCSQLLQGYRSRTSAVTVRPELPSTTPSHPVPGLCAIAHAYQQQKQ